MIRIVHFSDWHGNTVVLPEADLYVCTGDMLRNHPVVDRDPGSNTYRQWKIVADNEHEKQGRWIRQFVQSGGYRPLLASPNAPIVCVRGNHDYVDLAPMFDGCNFVHEFLDNELVTAAGLRITGHRGVPLIYGTWNDEMQRPDLLDRVRRMPDADLFVTHYPPGGILDSSMPPGLSMGGGWAESFGLDGMAQAIIRKVSSDFLITDSGISDDAQTTARAAHCFGHIHECGGYRTQAVDVMFSNAATCVNVFDIEPQQGQP